MGCASSKEKEEPSPPPRPNVPPAAPPKEAPPAKAEPPAAPKPDPVKTPNDQEPAVSKPVLPPVTKEIQPANISSQPPAAVVQSRAQDAEPLQTPSRPEAKAAIPADSPPSTMSVDIADTLQTLLDDAAAPSPSVGQSAFSPQPARQESMPKRWVAPSPSPFKSSQQLTPPPEEQPASQAQGPDEASSETVAAPVSAGPAADIAEAAGGTADAVEASAVVVPAAAGEAEGAEPEVHEAAPLAPAEPSFKAEEPAPLVAVPEPSPRAEEPIPEAGLLAPVAAAVEPSTQVEEPAPSPAAADPLPLAQSALIPQPPEEAPAAVADPEDGGDDGAVHSLVALAIKKALEEAEEAEAQEGAPGPEGAAAEPEPAVPLPAVPLPILHPEAAPSEATPSEAAESTPQDGKEQSPAAAGAEEASEAGEPAPSVTASEPSAQAVAEEPTPAVGAAAAPSPQELEPAAPSAAAEPLPQAEDSGSLAAVPEPTPTAAGPLAESGEPAPEAASPAAAADPGLSPQAEGPVPSAVSADLAEDASVTLEGPTSALDASDSATVSTPIKSPPKKQAVVTPARSPYSTQPSEPAEEPHVADGEPATLADAILSDSAAGVAAILAFLGDAFDPKEPCPGLAAPADEGAEGAEEGAALDPLTLAVSRGKVRSTEALLASGMVDVNEPLDEDGFTAAHIAAIEGQTEVLGVLLKLGADITARDATGNQPLHVAIQAGCAPAVEILVASGASVAKDRGQDGLSCIALAAGSPNPEEMVVLCLSYGCGLEEPQDEDGSTAFIVAVCNGLWEGAAALVAAGADPNGRDASGNTALHELVSRGECSPEDIDRLIGLGTDLEALGADGLTALGLASQMGLTSIMVALVRHGAGLAGPGSEGIHLRNGEEDVGGGGLP